MGTVLSHIIHEKYSGSFEDIVSAVLVYILEESNLAKAGMNNLLRSVVKTLPDLDFKTQWTKENTRPDIWGMSDYKERAYIENKFWAGLTDNQPVTYLRNLSKIGKDTILLFVVPEKREQAIRGELARRLIGAEINFEEREHLPTGIVWAVDTDLGTPLALTSWPRLIKLLESAAGEEKETIENLEQLRSLCELADNSSFTPFTEEFLNDQIIPGYLMQIGNLIDDAIITAKREKIISTERLTDSKIFGKYGRYASLNNKQGVGILLCFDFDLWKKTGRSPLWVKFLGTRFGQAQKVKPLLEKWKKNNELLIEKYGDGIAVAIDILPYADKDQVLEDIIRQIKQLSEILIEVQRADI